MAGIALEPIHTGAGRSPGVVDLPVERDSMGYPVVPRSGFKGALKQHCFYASKCIDKCKSLNCFRRGRIDTESIVRRASSDESSDLESCLLCCCAWGPEPEHGDQGASKLLVTDLLPFAYIARASGMLRGYVYVTSDWLLERLTTILRIARDYGLELESKNGKKSNLNEVIEKLARLASAATDHPVLVAPPTRDVKENEVELFFDAIGISVKARAIESDATADADMLGWFAKTLYGDEGVVYDAANKLLVLPSDQALAFIEALLYRRARIRLLLDTKTVAEGALWTEEYIPLYTLLVGLIAETRFDNACCQALTARNADVKLHPFGNSDTIYLQVGGKTSIGAGTLLLRIIAATNKGE